MGRENLGGGEEESQQMEMVEREEGVRRKRGMKRKEKKREGEKEKKGDSRWIERSPFQSSMPGTQRSMRHRTHNL